MPKVKKAAKSSMPNKSASTPSKPGGTQNKSAFVRSLPPTLSAKDVVAQAKAKGMTLSENYVYTIRSAANIKKTAPGKPGRPAGSGAAGRPAAAASSNGSIEARFVDLALDLGLGNAEKLLAKLRSSIKSVTLG